MLERCHLCKLMNFKQKVIQTPQEAPEVKEEDDPCGLPPRHSLF